MNFKKFNGTTWETAQHKIYGSGTDSLTAFPAMIQAAGEPLTDCLISGNTVQNGTHSHEAPVDVVGCGIWDETEQSYKLPITVNGTEYPIYLGQVETTRKIKKLVLTGDEGWDLTGNVFYTTNVSPDYRRAAGETTYMCSHFPVSKQVSSATYVEDNTIAFGSSIYSQRIYCTYTGASTVADFKSYLAAQYVAGTPVTVWYILAEPEAAVVNEPLMKIGDYADTITMAQAGVTIPTSDGDNTITFGTTVQPSAMSATFKGWHPVQGAKQYDGNDWS